MERKMAMYTYTAYLFLDSQTGYFGAFETEPKEKELNDYTYTFFKVIYAPHSVSFFMYHPFEKQWVKLEPKEALEDF